MATEKRLISLDEALEATHKEVFWTESEQAAVRSFLVKQPKVDAVEVVHGRWVDRYGEKYANHLYECSECHKKAAYKFEYDSLHIGLWVQDLTDYCPNCGCKMDGDGNG